MGGRVSPTNGPAGPLPYWLAAVVGAGILLLAAACSREEPGSPAGGPPPPAEAVRFVTIGTGDFTGVYYPTGGAIARIINRQQKTYGIRATVESTSGSVFNIDGVVSGDLEFGVVQSDRQYQAVEGLAEWKDRGSQRDLRAVFSIHPESITLVAAVDSGIRSLADLRGKRVNIGNPGSGQRQNAIDALTLADLSWQTDLESEGVSATDASLLLQDGRIDAFFYTVGHPSDAIREASRGATRVAFVPITGVDALLERHPYYARASIPVSLYPGVDNREDVPTFGVKASLVTSAGIPDDVVYAVTREVFENLESFRETHPALGSLTREGMLEGLSAPIHPGAMRYFAETGLKPPTSPRP